MVKHSQFESDLIRETIHQAKKCTFSSCLSSDFYVPLQWRHNHCDGIWKYRGLDCLLNRLFRRRSKKHQSPRSLAFVRGYSHKGPTTRKMFPFDDLSIYICTNEWDRASTLPSRPRPSKGSANERRRYIDNVFYQKLARPKIENRLWPTFVMATWYSPR